MEKFEKRRHQRVDFLKIIYSTWESMWPMWPSSLFFDTRKSCSFTFPSYFSRYKECEEFTHENVRTLNMTVALMFRYIWYGTFRKERERCFQMSSLLIINCYRSPMSLHKPAEKRGNTPYLIFHSLCESPYVAIIFSPLILKLVKNHIYSWKLPCIP